MKRLFSKRLGPMLLVTMAPLILTSCFEVVQLISHSEGKFHYEYWYSFDEEAITSWYDLLGLGITAEEMEEMYDVVPSPADSLIEDFSNELYKLEEEFGEVSTSITKVDDYSVDVEISFPENPWNARLRDATLPIKPLRTLIPLFPLGFMQDEKEEVTDTTSSQGDDLDTVLIEEAMFYDSYWSIAIHKKLLPDDIWGVELCNMDLEGLPLDYEYKWDYLIVKIPMAKFMDGASYTHLYIY